MRPSSKSLSYSKWAPYLQTQSVGHSHTAASDICKLSDLESLLSVLRTGVGTHPRWSPHPLPLDVQDLDSRHPRARPNPSTHSMTAGIYAAYRPYLLPS
jgi:hypothetical protein